MGVDQHGGPQIMVWWISNNDVWYDGSLMGVDLYGGPQIMVLLYDGARMMTYGVNNLQWMELFTHDTYGVVRYTN